MKTQDLKASITAAAALTAAVALSPLSTLQARETTVTLGQGDTVTVQAVDKRIIVDSSGNVKIQDNNAGQTAQMRIGQYIAGKGIYAGQWKPVGLSQTFNLYADTRDLGMMTFRDAVQRVANLKNRDGHDGFNHDANDVSPEEVLYKALRSGSYKGEWFIPPEDVLIENLYKNRAAFREEGAFVTNYDAGDYAHWYWSCTERSVTPSYVYGVAFAGGGYGWGRKDNLDLSSRVVRAEPAAP